MRSIYSTIVFLSATLFLQAQNSPAPPIQSEQIDIVKSFEPELIRSSRITQQPNLPKITSDSARALSYDVTDRLVKVGYNPGEVRPASYSSPVSKEDMSIARLKAGFGSYLSPLIDFQMANRKQETYSAGMGLDYFSARNKKVENQQMMRLSLDGNFNYYFDKFYVGANAGFGMHRVHFYGYDDEDTTFTEAETRHTYNTFHAGATFGNIGENEIGLAYKGAFNVLGISNSYGHKEIGINFNADASKSFLEHYGAGLKLEGESAALKGSLSNRSEFNLGITPYFRAAMDIWQLTAGLSLWIAAGDIHLFPDIRNQVKIYKDYLVMYNEWYGRAKLNTLRDAAAENPFLSANIDWENYRLETRNFVGIKGALPFGIDYDILFAQQVYHNKPLFLNDTLDFRKFNYTYDNKVSALNPHIGIGYRYSDMFRSALTFDYYIYKTANEAEAWHMPALRLGWHNTFQWNGKFTAKATILVNSGMKALNEMGNTVTLSPNVDVNLELAYQLNKYIGFFAQLNNMAFSKYYEYYRYPSYAFSVMGGLVVSY